MAHVVLRYETADAAKAVGLVKRCHKTDVTVARMERFLANAANYLLVAEVDGEPAGFLLAYSIDRLDEDAAAMFVYEIAVAQEHQRKGLGTALISTIRGIAKRERMIETFVFTNYSNEGAVRFYKSTGGIIENGDDLLFVYPER